MSSLQDRGARGGIEHAEALGARNPCTPWRAVVRDLGNGASSVIEDPYCRSPDTAWSEAPGFDVGSDPDDDYGGYQSMSPGEPIGGIQYATAGDGVLPGVQQYLSPSATPPEELSLSSIYSVPWSDVSTEAQGSCRTPVLCCVCESSKARWSCRANPQRRGAT